MRQKQKATVDELMVAMDAIDALRHQNSLVEQELNADKRRAQLIERLKKIYAESGIEVSERMLEAGVDALEKERFAYKAPPKSSLMWLAKLYIYRDKWLKPLLWAMGVGIIAIALYYAVAIWPQRQAQEALPKQIQERFERAIKLAKNSEALTRIKHLNNEAKSALAAKDYDTAKRRYEAMGRVLEALSQRFVIRIVQQPGHPSGIWRVPPNNPGAKNYYLIVEAVDDEGKRVALTIKNEEDDTVSKVTRWGIRVDKDTFMRVARDKQDDGIIQRRLIGRKERGELTPRYDIPTSGGTITKW